MVSGRHEKCCRDGTLHTKCQDTSDMKSLKCAFVYTERVNKEKE